MKQPTITAADLVVEAERIVPRRLITGVVWYTPTEWARMKAIAVDPDNFGASYEEWAALVAAEMAKLPRYDEVRPVNIAADDVAAWCREHDREVDSQARVEYMMTVVRMQQETIRAGVLRNLARQHGVPESAIAELQAAQRRPAAYPRPAHDET